MTERLLTIEEVCQKLGGVKPWTARSWVSQRKIPYAKVGRLTRFPEDHINQWIRATCPLASESFLRRLPTRGRASLPNMRRR